VRAQLVRREAAANAGPGSGPSALGARTMMITHHQGAIRMARAELTKGGNAQLRTIARAILSAQKREITEMNLWRKQWYGGRSPSGGIRPA
jgi:ABC-type cobalamin transport system ATPase subunit